MTKLIVIFCNFADVPNNVFRLIMNDKIHMQDNQSWCFTQSIILSFLISSSRYY